MTELPVVAGEQAFKRTKPDWLRVKLPIGESYKHVRSLVDTHKLHTICESGNCPNMGECWGAGTATFMILGNVCTRSCGFCAVATGRPEPLDWNEPQRVAEAINLMKVKHAVITSVDRDEIKDGGSVIWFNTIKAVKALNPDLLATSLATCMLTVMGIKAKSMGIEMDGINVDVEKIMKADPRRVGSINLTVHIPDHLKNADEKSKQILKHTGDTCPVMKSIHPDIEVRVNWGVWS
jgi:lipoate synthase